MLKKAITRAYDIPYQFPQNRGIITEVHISDIHFGVISAAEQYKILEEQFLNKIVNINFDILSIDGDLFDHKFQANSDVVMYAIRFVDYCVDLCRSKGATLILLHGTAYHDASQLKLFYNYLEDPTLDIRIVETAKFEYVKGMRILCIPEEYNKGEMYYRNFLDYSGLYDSVFMHGTIKGAIHGADHEDLNSKREPVFSIDSFKNCMGPIISGHVHTPGCFASHIYYNGSPIRWQFGEEAEKGFTVVLHNLDTQQYYVHYEEIKSFRYDTVNLDHMIKQDPKNIITYVQSLKDQGIDHIRLEFTKENEDVLSILRTYYKTSRSVRLHEVYKNNKEKAAMLTELQERYSDYDYILDDNLSPYEKLTRYINQNKGYEYITTDQLIEVVTNPNY